MRFFALVGVTLFFVALFNIIFVSVEMGMRSPVYACSEVTKKDPIDVRKKCKV
jgi:hypothetical protein